LGGKTTPMLEFLRKIKDATTQLQVIGEKMEDNCLVFWEPYNTNVGVKTKVGLCLIGHKYKEASYNKNIEGLQERAL